ncbi:hypothetical protein QQY79_17885 [Flavobacterium tructae]|uniref:hypothetical protein n=1 Tax=Flavobacterium tructae TaxID=1114873 RepID=UPI002551E607|nr:hypothetical protein [Flavobacterium tructae]MDL2144403.1 hypothetical protein [Flavobacterium tructae]
MEKINTLINDIQKFQIESTEQYNRNNEINREQYFKLVYRLEELKVEDFSTSEKYEYFLRYWNQDVRKVGRFVISDSFKNNYIDLNSFLILSNDFIGAVSWLKN